MKTVITILFLAISSFTFALSAGPKISAPEAVFDFGEITEGTLVSHDFVIKNEGDETLVITKVKASCGCTAAKPEKSELAPGESTTIKVKFNSARRKGNQNKHVYVFSNDPGNPQFRLSFTTIVLAAENQEKQSQEKENKTEG